MVCSLVVLGFELTWHDVANSNELEARRLISVVMQCGTLKMKGILYVQNCIVPSVSVGRWRLPNSVEAILGCGAVQAGGFCTYRAGPG